MAETRSECVALVPEDTDVRMIHSSDERQPELHASRRLVMRVTTCLVVLALAMAFLACVREGLTNDILRRKRPSEATAQGALKNTRVESQVVLKKNEESAEEHCPGCTDPNYRCIYLEDLSYSQCVDCSPVGNWRNDCAVWNEPLRRKAVDTCGLACGDMLPPKGSVPVVEPYCHMGSMEPAYAHDRCQKMKDHSLRISCDSKDPNECGVELSSHVGTGGGLYTVSMQAGRGAGLSSKFYLYTYGYGKDRSNPWNEIAIEVLGKSCSPDGTQISTDLVGGPYDEAADYWSRETSYQEFITVPFDACADWHEYSIDIASNKVKWVADGKVYRQVDISGLEDLITALYKRDLQAHLTLVGQDETAGNWDQMGFLSQNTEEFPIYAWFANIVVPTDDDAESQRVDPYADVEVDGATSDDAAPAAGESSGEGSNIAEEIDHNVSRDNVQIFAARNISNKVAEALRSEDAERPRPGGITHAGPEHDGDAGGTETTTYNAEQLEGGHSATPDDDAAPAHGHGTDPGHPSTTGPGAARATTSTAGDQEGSDTTTAEDDDGDRAEDTDGAEDTGDADGTRTTTTAEDLEDPGSAKPGDADRRDAGHADAAGHSKAGASSRTSSDDLGAPGSGDGAVGPGGAGGERAGDAGGAAKPTKDEPKGVETARSKGAGEEQAGDADAEEEPGGAGAADPEPRGRAEPGHPDAPDSKGTRTTTFLLQGSDAVEAGFAEEEEEAGGTDGADASEPDSDSTHTTTFPLGFLED